MFKALSLLAGIAVIIVGVWLLLAPDTGSNSGTTALDSARPTPAGTDMGQGAVASDSAGPTYRTPGTPGSNAAKQVSHWPDPNATAALPARPDNPARNARPVVELWQADSNPVRTEVDGFPAIRLKADPDALDSLHVGQQVALDVPQLNRTLTARLTSTHNQLNNIEVFRGPVSGGHQKDNVIVTRGKASTYVVLSTRQGVYSAVIDNRTGDAVLTSEADVQDNLAGEQDAIPVPGIEQTPPGMPAG